MTTTSMTSAASAKQEAAGEIDPVYGVLQLGSSQIALPLEVLREVIPCPPQFSGLPAAAPGLLGAISLRGKVLPVLDLRAVLGLPTHRDSNQVVVSIRHAGTALGLLIDGVCGLTRLPADTLNAMTCEGQPLLFSGSFERTEDGAVVSVLDAAAVMRLPGVPLLRDDPGSDAAQSVGTGITRHALMLVRCGDIHLAVDVIDIHATLPTVTLHPSSMDGRVCRGVIEYAGLRLPAVDPLALMELGQLPEGVASQALLLRFPTGLVALLVTQVIDIASVADSDLLRLSPLAVRRPDMFRAALHVPGHGEHLVVATGMLPNEPELLSLSTLNVRQTSAQSNVISGENRLGCAVITYDIGTEVATRLTQVSEVLPFPTEWVQPASAHPAVIGMFAHRGQAVTMVCLSSLLDASVTPDPLEARMLLVGIDGAHLGFIVPRLRHIENTVWEQPSDRSASQAARSLLGRHAVIELGSGAQRRTLHLIDLIALARSLMAEVRAVRPDIPCLEAEEQLVQA